MRTFLTMFLILCIVALIIAVIYDYLTPSGAAVGGVALRLVLFELRRILVVIPVVLVIAFFLKYGGDIQKAKAIIEDARGLVNSGVKYLEVYK